jgi:hypothetical protein
MKNAEQASDARYRLVSAEDLELSGLFDPRVHVCDRRFTPNGRVPVPTIS